MKVWLSLVLVAILGAAAGSAFALVRYQQWPWGGSHVWDQAAARTPVATTDVKRPAVQVDNETFDFGTMDVHATGSHEFVLRNVGDAPLELNQGSTSCKCTLSELAANTVVPPGGETKVKLTWTAKEFAGPFQQTATILTNDPSRSRVVLTVSGRISVAARAVPGELVFSRITAGELARGSVQLFGYRPEPLEIQDFRWEDQASAKFFDARLTTLPADQVKQEDGATSGQLLEITVKSGLPLGPFQQRISLATNQKEAPTIEVPVRGKVQSEVSIVGPGWSEEDGMLMLGTVDGRQGAQRTLLIIAGGKRGKDIRFTGVNADPGLLKVELGVPRPLKDGQATQTPLTITIPPGSPPANHLGSEQGKLGRITIDTDHPNTPQLRILVRFAVKG